MKSVRTDPRNHAAEGDEPYDHSKVVAQFVVGGHSIPLTDDEAWDLAWKLIGFCVEHRRARAEVGT